MQELLCRLPLFGGHHQLLKHLAGFLQGGIVYFDGNDRGGVQGRIEVKAGLGGGLPQQRLPVRLPPHKEQRRDGAVPFAVGERQAVHRLLDGGLAQRVLNEAG